MSLKFLTWNLENFFLLPATSATYNPKPKEKVEAIAQVFKELTPDIAFVMEVGGLASLDHFNEHYLNEKYRVFLKRGNSNRGIEVGYLIKRSFLKKYDLIADLISHSHKPINFLYPHEHQENKKALIKGHKNRHHSHRMSRDLAELRLYQKSDGQKERPVAIFLGAHLKSKLDRDGIDWQGTKRRRAELKYCLDIYQKRENTFHGKCPLFLTGDFNGECHQQKLDPEFQDLAHLSDEKGLVLDFSDHLGLAREECVSFIGMDKAKKPFPLQLDYFFFHERWLKFIEKEDCGFYRYKNPEGMPYPIPQNPGARFSLPSDHYPLITSWNDQILAKGHKA